jgi:Sulfotransferase domain
MNPPPVQTSAKHLIIAGVTRAGTTSLFNYLGEHPGIHPSTIKETRFFLKGDELRRMHRFEDGPDSYDTYFPNCPDNATRLEATPDYLFCPAAATRIADTLPDAHIVVILREPISRLISWRRYAIQNGLLNPDTTLAQYIQTQFDAEAAGEDMPQHMRALQEGRYSRYLSNWIETFDRSRLTICHYNDLLTDPAAVIRRICQNIGIDPAFYDGYSFAIHNESRSVRWPRIQSAYRSLIWRIKPFIHDKPATRAALRKLRRSTDAAMGRTGKTSTTPPVPNNELTPKDMKRLEDYYQHEPAALANMLGLPNWQW